MAPERHSGRFICAAKEEEPNEIEMLSHQTIEIGLVHQPDSHLLDNNEGERDLKPQEPLQKVLDVASAICIQIKTRLVRFRINEILIVCKHFLNGIVYFINVQFKLNLAFDADALLSQYNVSLSLNCILYRQRIQLLQYCYCSCLCIFLLAE